MHPAHDFYFYFFTSLSPPTEIFSNFSRRLLTFWFTVYWQVQVLVAVLVVELVVPVLLVVVVLVLVVSVRLL